jgi:hypothetical protein
MLIITFSFRSGNQLPGALPTYFTQRYKTLTKPNFSLEVKYA